MMIKCSPGFYTTFAATQCSICPSGFKCADPTLPPEACPPLTYTVPGQTECTACPKGSVCPGNGEIIQCSPGELCRSDKVTFKESCPPGFNCPYPEKAEVLSCIAGTYSGENATKCEVCPPGHMCPQGSIAPKRCSDGTYTDLFGRTECLKCPKGFMCNSNSISKVRCELGTYSPEGAGLCYSCLPGYFCPHQEIDVPQLCPKGTYSLEKQSYCSPCPQGYSCEDRKSQTACPTGQYSLNNMDSCHLCPAGYECGSWGKPMPCSPGQYSIPGSLACTYCQKGEMCHSPKHFPAKCALGYYQDEIGKQYCKKCPVGYTCLDQASAPIVCAIGKFTDQFHQQCYTCPAGYDCTSRSHSTLKPCPTGTYSLSGSDTCTLCPPGFFCPRPDQDKQECPLGTYSADGQICCHDCPLGYQCLDKQGKYIVKCLEGQYLHPTTKTCRDCPAGYACPASLAQIGYGENYYACPLGSYSTGGQTECTLCPPGKYCTSNSQAIATDCPSGQISFGGAYQCMKCPKNYECPTKSSLALCPAYFYSPEGESSCKPCPDGMNCMYPNATLADSMCLPGYYMKTLDYSCQLCPYGYYCNGATLEPIECPAGSYSGMQGSTQCTACPIGYYSYSGSEYCQPSAPGYYSKNGELLFCEEGTYSDWSYSKCEVCPRGFLCPRAGDLGMQYACPLGSYCVLGVQFKCKLGYYGIMERGSNEDDSCAVCPAGYFCLEGTDNLELNPCPRGHFCPVMTGLPKECPAGSYNELLYRMTEADCQQCPMGRQCDVGTENDGDICQEGYFCPLGSKPGQYPCPAGTFGGYRTGHKDPSECQICPAGYYCPEGTADPLPSPPGYYQPLFGIGDLEALIICPPVFFCPDEAMTSYKGNFCQVGYYCPAGSISATEKPCPEGTFSDSREIFDASQCLHCPRGFKCAEASSTLQGITPCPMHQYCPLRTKASEVFNCIAGTYAPYEKSKSVEDCIECPFGSYCLSGQAPQICSQGYFCPNGTQFEQQYPCPKGTYLDQEGGKTLAECKPCGLGHFCLEGNSVPSSCQNTYNDFSNMASECKLCPAGAQCGIQTITPIVCPPGMYSQEGDAKCSFCPAGYFCPDEGTTKDQMLKNICPVGLLCVREYSSTPITYSHIFTGEVNSQLGKVGLSTYPNLLENHCHVGYYCPMGTEIMIACPVGTYNRLKARKSLTDCALVEGGFYVDTEASTTWTGECNPGHYCPDGSVSKQQAKCPTGTYRSLTRGSKPSDCSICPSGSYCRDYGMSQPVTCPRGFYCPLGTINPESCPEGTYGASAGLTDSKSCTSCPSGYYCGKKSLTLPETQCDEGYFCIKGAKRPEPTDMVTGAICPAGGYCTKGVSEPISCPAGTFNMFEGAESSSDCSACWPGYYCQGSNLPEPTGKCPEGYYCLERTITPSLIAQAGYYSPEGSAAQIKCPRGYYNPLTQQGSCRSCESGYYCPDQGMTTPQICPIGHYCPSNNYFVENEIFYDKLRCPKGTYNPSTGQRNQTGGCLPCPTGKYCESEGLSTFSGSCSEGFFCKLYAESPTPSDTHKYGYYGPCPIGFYCQASSTEPTPCPIGTFSIETQASSATVCIPCTEGTYCASEGISAPTGECDAGYYCPEGQSTSKPNAYQCSTGQYCPIGATHAKTCPVGFYQPNPTQGRCLVCPKGFYCVFGERKICPKGYICP